MTQSPFPPGPPGNPGGPPPGAWTSPQGEPSYAGPPPGAPPGPTTTLPDQARGWDAPEPLDVPGRTGLPYHLMLRGGWTGTWWRGLIGIAVLGLGMVIVLPLVVLLPFVAYYVLTGGSISENVRGLVDLTDPSPASLAYLNLTLAGLIPATWLVVRYLHGLRPRWLSSVRPRLRWGYLFVCVGLSVVALIATVIVSSLLPAAAGSGVTGDLNEFTPELRDFVLVVVLLTPLQAAAEEYAFRGYLLQAFGGMVRHPAFAVGLSSLLFALAHGAGQDIPIFFDRFAFGVVAGTLVIVTGGLEAGIAMHVLNNWLAFGLAISFGDLGSALNPTGGTWWSIPVTLTQSLVYLGLAWWVARKMGLSRHTDPGVLAAPEGRV